MTGEWPVDQVDHIDLNRSNNAWANLRQADNAQNSANSKKYANNKSGHKGVFWDKERQLWQAKITVNYRQIMLGRYASKEAAATAYQDAATKHFGKFARAA